VAARPAMALAAIGLAIAGCAAHADPARRTWHEVRTRRFTLVTDLSSDRAVERAKELEALGAALNARYILAVPRGPAPAGPARVIHLASCEDLRRRDGRTIGGFVAESPDFGYERLIVTCNYGAMWTEIVLHELTHDLNHRYLASLPAWLEEGLATYYQTLDVEGDKVMVGRAPGMDAHYWQDVAILPRLDELLTMSQAQLVGLESRRGYFAAWKLTHLLANGSRDNHRRFGRLLVSLATERDGQERDAQSAFRAAFGDVLDQVTADYRLYHRRRDLNIWNLPYKPADGSDEGAVQSRTLRRGEVQALWIEFWLAHNARSEVLDHLARLEREDPAWPRRLYWRAVVQSRLRLPGVRPVELLRKYVRQAPDDGQGWLALVNLEMDRFVPDGHLGIEPEPPPGLEQIEEQVRGLVRVSATSAQLDQVGWYYALRRKPQIGLNFTIRALDAEPGCGNCWDTLALLYYHAGRVNEAVAAQERAVALLAERGVSPAVKARLVHYRRAAAGVERPTGR
jgi:hypothetical protein